MDCPRHSAGHPHCIPLVPGDAQQKACGLDAQLLLSPPTLEFFESHFHRLLMFCRGEYHQWVISRISNPIRQWEISHLQDFFLLRAKNDRTCRLAPPPRIFKRRPRPLRPRPCRACAARGRASQHLAAGAPAHGRARLSVPLPVHPCTMGILCRSGPCHGAALRAPAARPVSVPHV